MITVRQRPIALLALVVSSVICLVLLSSHRSRTIAASLSSSPLFPSSWRTQSPSHLLSSSSAANDGERPYGANYAGHSSPTDINRVVNRTLGFGKIFVVGLPERTDKRDALALMASLTGFEVEWIDGVRGESIPDKAVPFGVDRKKLMETNLGSWRGHMNAARRIVEEGLDSALIMEDDMDWDVRLKPQLELIAAGARSVMADIPSTFFPDSHPRRSRSSSRPRSPYGDDWDIIWLGHCGEPFPENLEENRGLLADDPARAAMSRKFVISDDATVPPREKLTGLVDWGKFPEHTRWVHVTAAPICSFAYALSQRGAQNVLFDLSVDRLAGPFDNSLAWLCRRAVSSWPAQARGDVKEDNDRGLDTKCLSVTPPVFFHHRAKGLVAADSDIQVVTEDDKLKSQGAEVDATTREKGFTENILWSTRLNIRNMILGRPIESQY